MNDMKTMIEIQRLEITCEKIYDYLSKKIKNKTNAQVLSTIAKEEKGHYNQIKAITKVSVKPYIFFMWRFRIISRVLGVTFGIKVIEKKEEKAIKALNQMEGATFDILNKDSMEHEQKLLDIIDEEKLHYLGSIVLGLNDALVELSGALAGFTFAFADTRLIAVTGLITGISASLSMAASEYLSSKAEGNENSLKSSIYTGIAYIVTVILLITPYLVFANPYFALGITISTAMLIIAAFSYYMSVVQEFKFGKRFIEMACISLGVTLISFLIGLLINFLI